MVKNKPILSTLNKTSALIILLISQLYYQVAICPVHPIDSFQDIAFVYGYSFPELIGEQYQYYLYGFFPYIIAWLGAKFTDPIIAFGIINTVLAGIYSITLSALVFYFVRSSRVVKTCLSLLLSCLLLNPGNAIFGWKIPYTIGLPIGVIFSLFFIIAAVDYANRGRGKNLFYLFVMAICVAATKLEYAFLVAIFLPGYLIALFWLDKSLVTKRKWLIIFGLVLFLANLYVNWMKFLPPEFKIWDWCSDDTAHLIITGETMSQPSEGVVGASNHLLKILGLIDIDPVFWIEVLIQVFLIYLLWLLDSFRNKGDNRFSKYLVPIIVFYIIYVALSGYWAPADRFKTTSIVSVILLFFIPKKYWTIDFLIFGAFSIVLSARTIFSIQFGYFSIFYMPLVMIFFYALCSRLFSRKYLLFIYMIPLLILAVTNFKAYVVDSHEDLKIISLPNRPRIQASLYTAKLVLKVEELMKQNSVETIGSAKNIPFINVLFHKNNPVKQFVNVEFYPMGYTQFTERYFRDVEKNLPDMFIYTEETLKVYLTREEHHNFPMELYNDKNESFVRRLSVFYHDSVRVENNLIFYNKIENS